MRILTVADGDPELVTTWSGIPAFASRALADLGHEIIPFKPAQRTLATAVVKKLHGTTRLLDLQVAATALEGRRLRHLFINENADLVIGFASSSLLSSVCDEVPCVHVSDATYAAVFEYYEAFSGFSDRKKSHLNGIEQRVLHRSKISSLSSRWAVESALRDYKAPASSVILNPLGACLSDLAAPSAGYPEQASFFWCGVDWVRKGGDVALDAVAELRRRGYEATLTVAGCDPPQQAKREYVRYLGFLNKNKPDELKKLGRHPLGLNRPGLFEHEAI